MTIDIQISTGSSTPIYWQIVEHVTRAISKGELTSGEQLPSVRALAERLLVNPNTVSRAYSDLVRDGVVEAQRGKGLFVSNRTSVLTESERQRRLEDAIDIFLHDIRLLDFKTSHVLQCLNSRWPEAVLSAPKG